MSTLDGKLYVELQDGSIWSIPVAVIAQHRAEYFRDEFGGEIERSLNEDTIPLFEYDDYEVKSWAKHSMNWSDVVDHAMEIEGSKLDYEDGWSNGHMEIVL